MPAGPSSASRSAVPHRDGQELTDLHPTTEAEDRDVDDSDAVIDPGLTSIWVRDLPLCFPGRACIDVPPGGAQAMYLISDLTIASPGIAAALWTGLGTSLVLLGTGLRQYRRASASRPWPVLLAIALVVGGAALAWSAGAWLGEAAIVYRGDDGRPPEPIPSSVIGSWPLVQAAGRAGIALGAIALLLMLIAAVVRRHRSARAREAGLDER